jgi:hypothetical protein
MIPAFSSLATNKECIFGALVGVARTDAFLQSTAALESDVSDGTV